MDQSSGQAAQAEAASMGQPSRVALGHCRGGDPTQVGTGPTGRAGPHHRAVAADHEHMSLERDGRGVRPNSPPTGTLPVRLGLLEPRECPGTPTAS